MSKDKNKKNKKHIQEHNHDHEHKVIHDHDDNHSHDHEHGHSHGHFGHNHSYKNIGIAFILNFFFSLVEFVGGILTNSVAIISDAIHDMGDAVSLVVSWALEKYSKKSPDKKYTFGYGRFSLLAALINSLVLLVGSTFVLISAIPRLLNPEQVNAEGMLYIAILGIVINLAAFFSVSKGQSLNEKTVSWHLFEDVLGWFAVLITSIVLMFVNFPILDSILSILITLFILYKVGKNLVSIFKVFLEATPDGSSIDDISKAIIEKTDAIDIHHIHVWTLDGINHYLTAHIVIKDNSTDEEIVKIKSQIRDVLKDKNMKHITIEIEFESEVCLNDKC